MSRPTEIDCVASNYPIFSQCFKNLNPNQQRAADLYFKVLELAALGGTDYTDELGNGGALVTASVCDKCLDDPDRWLARMWIDAANASNAGATLPSLGTNEGVQSLAAAIACLNNFDPNTLDAMDLHVTCLLGRHAAYPQVDR